jgi:hypothetical protein
MEPTSSAASAATAFGAVAVTSLMPGVNGDALIGAFAGAVVFALHAKDLTITKRLVYMVVSILLGYMGADEVLRLTPLTSYALAAFGLSAVVVTFALAGIDKIRSFDITTFWKRG